MDKASSSSAEEENCDYNKIQSISSNKKGITFTKHYWLKTRQKIIKDSRTPVTLKPQRLFNENSVEKLNINYKDVNDNKIEFIGQTKATVRTNNTSTTVATYESQNHTANGTGLDETAWNSTQRNYRQYENT